MKLRFDEQAWEDYLYWHEIDAKKLNRIHQLIQAIGRDPFKGIGKPEPLKGNWSGFWSRRIDREHRLVYATCDDAIWIAQCRFRYQV